MPMAAIVAGCTRLAPAPCDGPQREVAMRRLRGASGRPRRRGITSRGLRFANLYRLIVSAGEAHWAVVWDMDTPTMSPRALPSLIAGAVLALLSGCVVAPPHVYAPPAVQPPQRTMYFYPELQQGEAKQDRDRYECYRWAVRQSGTDPGMTPLRGVPPPPPAAIRNGAEPAVGAATGAIVGAAVSSPHNAGQGMVLGAIFGGLLGAAAQEARVQSAEQAYGRHVAAQQAAQQVPIENFHRAMGACMTGRGYRVG